MIYVIEGRNEVFLGGRLLTAGPGAVIHFPRGVPHGFTNVGDATGRTLWVVTPGSSFEQFFEALGALPAGGPPDMARVTQIFAAYDIEILPPPEG